jgi:hypothetical protein
MGINQSVIDLRPTFRCKDSPGLLPPISGFAVFCNRVFHYCVRVFALLVRLILNVGLQKQLDLLMFLHGFALETHRNYAVSKSSIQEK